MAPVCCASQALAAPTAGWCAYRCKCLECQGYYQLLDFEQQAHEQALHAHEGKDQNSRKEEKGCDACYYHVGLL